MRIRAFERADEAAVVALWEECQLIRAWNDPRKDIARKLAVKRTDLAEAEAGANLNEGDEEVALAGAGGADEAQVLLGRDPFEAGEVVERGGLDR